MFEVKPSLCKLHKLSNIKIIESVDLPAYVFWRLPIRDTKFNQNLSDLIFKLLSTGYILFTAHRDVYGAYTTGSLVIDNSNAGSRAQKRCQKLLCINPLS
jgi:hypothetical protein